MKKNLFTKMMLCCLALTAPMFVASCGSDDDGEDPVTEVNPVLTTASVDYKYQVSEDLLQIADVQISYLDNNLMATETMTTTTWEKTGRLSTFPGQLGFTVLITPKANFSSLLRNSNYYFYYGNTKIAGGQSTIQLLDQKGQEFAHTTESVTLSGSEATVEPGNVYEYLITMNKPAYSYLCQIAKDGTVTLQTK